MGVGLEAAPGCGGEHAAHPSCSTLRHPLMPVVRVVRVMRVVRVVWVVRVVRVVRVMRVMRGRAVDVRRGVCV